MLTDEQAHELARAYGLRYIAQEPRLGGEKRWTQALFTTDRMEQIVYRFDSADSVEAALAARQARQVRERNHHA